MRFFCNILFITCHILGANDRVLVAGIGVGDRGNSVITDFVRQTARSEVVAVCDVDKRAIDKCVANDWNLWQGPAPPTLYKDNYYPFFMETKETYRFMLAIKYLIWITSWLETMKPRIYIFLN